MYVLLLLYHSGGNKRKLSTAIALIGNPQIILLVRSQSVASDFNSINKLYEHLRMNLLLEWIQLQDVTYGML